jgi:hypothetical protein
MHVRLLYRLAGPAILASMLVGTIGVAYARPQAALSQATTSAAFTPVADAYVTKQYPSTNYGSNPALRADGSPIVRSYLRFAVTGVNGLPVQAASIRLYAGSSNSTGFSVSALGNNTWSESTITYNTAPAPGSIINKSKSFSAGSWVSVDISSYIKSDGTYNLVVSTSSPTSIKLSSRETASQAPQLVLSLLAASTATPTTPTVQLPTATSTAAPTQTAMLLPTATLLPTQTATPAPTAAPASSPTPTLQTEWQPSFPIRATFYYPWFPEAWTQQGIYPYTNYHPQLGYYSSSDTTVLKKHIDMMQYGGIQAGIISWWGQGSKSDSRVPTLLGAASGMHFRWAIYYENESQGDPTVIQIQNDLAYIRDQYGSDPSFLRINGKFVVFVYADGNDGCAMADRWKQANTVGAYVVLKVFSGYLNCASQPNDWHQYAPAVAEDHQGNYSFSISPGFWLVGNAVRLSRDLTRWTQNVKDMVASTSRWQLVTTFSEWGEGTVVEPAAEWSSTSGYGQYLDVLHSNGNVP